MSRDLERRDTHLDLPVLCYAWRVDAKCVSCVSILCTYTTSSVSGYAKSDCNTSEILASRVLSHSTLYLVLLGQMPQAPYSLYFFTHIDRLGFLSVNMLIFNLELAP